MFTVGPIPEFCSNLFNCSICSSKLEKALNHAPLYQGVIKPTLYPASSSDSETRFVKNDTPKIPISKKIIKTHLYRECYICNVKSTPCWRKVADKIVCNRCGLKRKNQK